MTTTPWRNDPAFQGMFHPDFPDDLQVIVHDGEPRRTQRGLEACWVRVTGAHGKLRMPVAPPDAKPPIRAAQVSWDERRVYTGTLLNQPKQLQTAREGESILFVHSPGTPHPVRVTPQYLVERSQWCVLACDKCGADQSLDPPTIMAKTRFPNAPEGAIMAAFTAFCPCGGTMVLSLVEGAEPAAKAPAPAQAEKPWWKFW
ncbi:hypothetical protein [Polyangium sp. y55x31]|uniref:hypothetical protein n=1 Tax=Polyangium sp. y55x31 TaxID=3042688 RepID=UPI002482A293|nr:hypothetical protein [Polyangium sp. y55x31]MDI1479404.1 hypothetical protein [Polyangium sp. y55x31]